MKIVVAIATAGRREGLSQTLDYMKRQTRLPDAVYICPASEADFDPAAIIDYPCPALVVRGQRGSSSQRNAIIRAASDADVIIFFDDDFLPEPDYLKETEALFERNPRLVVATGHVIADGATGPGIGYDEAANIIARLKALPKEVLKPVFNGYGCNMVIRATVAREHRLEFDEILPLYAWWEDVDLSRRLAPHGLILNSNRLRGVHQGSKSGRSPGRRVGYSQVMNIVYLMKKGTVPGMMGLVRIARNILANLVRQFSPEPWVDRRGRFGGNMEAVGDVIIGRIDPGKILKM